jgi:hypothetical protein
MKRLVIMTALTMLLMALAAAPALDVNPGTYIPTADSFNPANAPGSSHLTSGTPQCIVAANLNVSCDPYVLGGVGNTNANVSLTGSYSATIDCRNHGGNVVESHTAFFSDTNSGTVTSSRNGQLRVPSRSISAFSAPQVCPNPNWTPLIRSGTLVLETFTYTLTFANFGSPYITITASDP